MAATAVSPWESQENNCVRSVDTTIKFSRLKASGKYTDMRRLTTGMRSEKCVYRRFSRRKNVIQCTYTTLGSTILVINQLNAQNLVYNKFIIYL